MASQPLLIFPDPRLHVRAAPVVAWDDGLRSLADDVADTLHCVSAIGLTAVHIGQPLRLMVIRLQPDSAQTIYVNPEIVWASPDRAKHQEGSVSMPGVTDRVERAAQARIRYRDLDGAERIEEADGFRAACLQHEIDQLDGIFWIERLTRQRRERTLKRYQAARRGSP